ncbi:uncharacterized protein [Antedon mediterranea]|uniref:uncharacterized protein n=1 Tax=Antedon mediterranea TaxID=105859 RepID=UPI003AF59188
MKYPIRMFIVAILFMFLSTFEVSCSSSPIVLTKYGRVKGFQTDEANMFYGIPYATPPIGWRRWRSPEEPHSWDPFIFPAVYRPPGCPQTCDEPPNACPETFSEDCLYLNIFSPLNTDATSGFPVMVFIHGGSFLDGGIGARIYDGRFIANMTETIVVTIAYRLGALGFLVVQGDDPIEGNFGFLDQQFALQFVQENIKQFGGDPDRVTLFGQSAGGQSVGLHLISNSSSHLFDRAIVESNPFTLPYRKHTGALLLGDFLALYLNCSLRDIDCMRRSSANDILQAQDKASLKFIDPVHLLQLVEAWGPTIGGELIPMHPIKAFQSGQFQHKPVLIGSLTEEGRIFVYEAFSSRVSFTEYLELVLSIFREDAYRVLLKYPPNILKLDQRDLLSKLVTDYIFTCSTRNITRGIVSHGMPNIYKYVFDHALSFREAWGKFTFCRGHVCHSSELPFVFHDATLAGYKYTHAELKLANSMVYYWANFAHNANPNQKEVNKTKKYLKKWPEFSAKRNWPFMRFKTPWSVVNRDFQNVICEFWDKIGYEAIHLLRYWSMILLTILVKVAAMPTQITMLAVFAFLLTCLLSEAYAKSVGNVAGSATCSQKYTDPVYTKYGTLQGILSSRARVFYGIPYAMPPVGKRRWKAPAEPHSVASNTFLSITQPPGCPQVCGDPVGTCPEVYNEDCLYLNIFTPVDTNENSNLPVMIFVHGGNFDHGGAATPLYDGQHLANTTNTILVVMNYRVGALGFLVADGEEESLDGNFAILDQRLAFKYVQENIAAFGGNPKSVTLFGQSAGAQSIAIHMTSSGSASLFQRSIMQSNPFTLPYRDRVSSVEIGALLAESLGCGSGDITCLRSRSADEVLKAQLMVASMLDYDDLLQNFEYWGPVIDGAEIPMHPLEAYAQNSFQDKPMIMGTMSEDALPYVYTLMPEPVSATLSSTVIIALFGLIDGLKLTNTYSLGLLDDDSRDVLSDMFTDMIFACSTRYASTSAQQNGQSAIYLYEFAHAFSFEEAWGEDMSFCYGRVCHGGDLPFIFQNANYLGYEYTPEEQLLSDSMVYYWTNFAHTGDPNEIGELSTVKYNPIYTEWPLFNTDDELAQLRLDTPVNVQLTNYKTDECDLFDSIGYDNTYSLSIELFNEALGTGNTE